MPLFSLGLMRRRLGYWSSEKKEIRLSRDFVLNYPWAAVREVLRHEMAHQVTEEVLGIVDETPHGPGFHKACLLLRIDPKASISLARLCADDNTQPMDTRDKILLRIKKLLALAESCNPHEAEAAMSKAHELIARYNVDLIAEDSHREFISVFLGGPALRHYREDYHLASLLGQFYFVYGLWVSAYVLDKSKMGRVLEISGTRANVEIASYVYDFVQHFIDNQWLEYNANKSMNRYRKTDFAVGIIEGFRHKLESTAKSTSQQPNAQALVRLQDPLLKKYVNYKYPHTTNFRRRVSSQDDRVLHAGMAKGRSLVISKGITQKSRTSGKMIAHSQPERMPK